MVFVCQTVHALRYASRAREVATLGAVSEKFLPTLGGGRKRGMAKPSARNVRGRAAPRMSQMPTLCEDGEESFAASASGLSTCEKSGGGGAGSRMAAELREAKATISKLQQQVDANNDVRTPPKHANQPRQKILVAKKSQGSPRVCCRECGGWLTVGGFVVLCAGDGEDGG